MKRRFVVVVAADFVVMVAFRSRGRMILVERVAVPMRVLVVVVEMGVRVMHLLRLGVRTCNLARSADPTRQNHGTNCTQTNRQPAHNFHSIGIRSMHNPMDAALKAKFGFEPLWSGAGGILPPPRAKKRGSRPISAG